MELSKTCKDCRYFKEGRLSRYCDLHGIPVNFPDEPCEKFKLRKDGKHEAKRT